MHRQKFRRHTTPVGVAHLIVFLLFDFCCFSMRGEQKADLSSRLLEASSLASLDTDGLKPWHLKLEVQTYDESGNPGEQGTVEEWWASPNQFRVVSTTPSSSSTELHNNGAVYFSSGDIKDSNLYGMVRQQMVHPMPLEEDDLQHAKLQEKIESFGKVKLDCVMVGEEIRGVSFLPYGLFPMYCLDMGGPGLRLSYRSGSLVLIRNRVGTFQNRSVPLDITVNDAGKKLVTAKVTTLQGLTPAATDFEPTDSLKKSADAPVTTANGVMAGHSLKKIPPIYPEGAKQRHVSGTVVMHAIIGKDGRIERLKLMSYPDGELAISALWSVRKWTYQPYLFNGDPVEVDTTITVNYNFQ